MSVSIKVYKKGHLPWDATLVTSEKNVAKNAETVSKVTNDIIFVPEGPKSVKDETSEASVTPTQQNKRVVMTSWVYAFMLNTPLPRCLVTKRSTHNKISNEK